jgi:ribonucleotide reductase alpha subunit
MANPHLLQDLTDRGLWNPSVRNQLMRDSGSVSNIDCIPQRLKELYKTVWELKMKDIIDMAADRGKFVDQSQSLNLFVADPTTDKLTAMHFYAWQKGLKVREEGNSRSFLSILLFFPLSNIQPLNP